MILALGLVNLSRKQCYKILQIIRMANNGHLPLKVTMFLNYKETQSHRNQKWRDLNPGPPGKKPSLCHLSHCISDDVKSLIEFNKIQSPAAPSLIGLQVSFNILSVKIEHFHSLRFRPDNNVGKHQQMLTIFYILSTFRWLILKIGRNSQ